MLLVLVRVPVEPGQCFPHHHELGLTVPLEDLRVALSEQSGGEGVT